MKKLKIILNISLVFVLIFSLSACRTKTTDTSSPVASEQEKIEIVWWSLFDPCDTFKGQIEEFQSKYSNYRVTCKKFTNPNQYKALLIDELAAGEGPDIFTLKNTDFKANYKKISPVPANIMVPDQFRDTFFAVAADDLIFETDEQPEQIWGVPIYIDTLALYYNKQLFRDNLPSTDKPDTTWEGIKEQVYALTKKDNSIERFAVSGIALGRADNIQRAIDIFSMMLLQHGTQMYNENYTEAVFADKQGTFEGTGEAYYRGVEALNLYTGFALSNYKYYSWNALITSLFPEQKEVGAFVKGKTAMIFGYSWLYDEIDLEIQAAEKSGKTHIALEDIGIAEVPQLVDPEKTGTKDAFASYYPLTVSRNSKNPEAAWEFIAFLASPSSLQDYHEKTHKPTPRKDMADEQGLESLFGVFARQASYAKSLDPVNDSAFNTIMSEAINSVAKSKSSAEEALQLAQKRMDCVLSKQKDPLTDTVCEEIE